jgi:hypothetical protein
VWLLSFAGIFFYLGISKFFETRLCFFFSLFFWVVFFIVYLNLSHLFCGLSAGVWNSVLLLLLPLKEGFDLFQSIVDFFPDDVDVGFRHKTRWTGE